MLKQIFFVGLGGGVGSILRYLVSYFTAKYYAGTFPVATFFINVTGCLIIGILAGFFSSHFSFNDNLKLLLITGFCGGYTTFSTFALENLNLLQYNHTLIMLLYVFLSVILGIIAVWLGLNTGSSI